MEHSLARFVIVLILFQCSQGTLHHFNAKRSLRHSDFIDRLESDENDNNIAVDKLSQLLRARRQAAGGRPVAYQSDLIMDDRQYAQIMYSGEGSEVNASCFGYFCVDILNKMHIVNNTCT